mgnify:CR=1 FL=1
MEGFAYNASYPTAAKPDNYDFVYGTGDVPSSWTVGTDVVPYVFLEFSDLQSIDAADAASGESTEKSWGSAP